ncbi:MAG TPA: hypothetical protein VJU82_05680 [Acidobacteriaceae bacterium]|nr:hypothetical protein [Acidobacteriaceae bacterium]
MLILEGKTIIGAAFEVSPLPRYYRQAIRDPAEAFLRMDDGERMMHPGQQIAGHQLGKTSWLNLFHFASSNQFLLSSMLTSIVSEDNEVQIKG